VTQRWTQTANRTAMERGAGSNANDIYFVELVLDSGTVRVHTHLGEITWGGNPWDGVGSLGTIEPIREDTTTTPRGIKLVLSGVPIDDEDLLSSAVGEDYFGRTARIYRGVLNEDRTALVANPELEWTGYIDGMDPTVGESATVEVRLEHRLFRDPAASRYTNEDQIARYPGDDGFEFLHMVGQVIGTWGEKPYRTGTPTPAYWYKVPRP
jgi:hypothetical protein